MSFVLRVASHHGWGLLAQGGCARAALFCISFMSAALTLGACSITMPFMERERSFINDPDVTGSITPRAPAIAAQAPGQLSPLSPGLDAEDWRRARAAMATALDPQGNGAQVRWDNPDSGAKGFFGAIGNPFLIKDDICRLFVAGVGIKAPEDWMQGSACRTAPGEWEIKDVKPWKKPT
jgi:surface antigen